MDEILNLRKWVAELAKKQESKEESRKRPRDERISPLGASGEGEGIQELRDKVEELEKKIEDSRKRSRREGSSEVAGIGAESVIVIKEVLITLQVTVEVLSEKIDNKSARVGRDSPFFVILLTHFTDQAGL